MPPPPLAGSIGQQRVRELVDENGLTELGRRPSFKKYVTELWEHRSFITVLAQSKAYAKNQNSYLGQVWSVLTPTLNALVYAIIFGIVLETSRGLENVIAFIVVGTFMFRFFERSISGGAKSVQSNAHLMRSLRFPRAVLPASTVMAELTTAIPAFVVMCVVSWASGLLPAYPSVSVTWYWLLLPFAILLMWMFNTGCAFIVARVVAITPDIQNIIPVLLRFGMYGSGVIFSISHYAGDGLFGTLLQYQPVAVYLYLARASLLQEPSIPHDPVMWAFGAGWAVLFFVIGFVVFWRGEERYGRD
ncbi:ABC transporter permease [Paraoerskovia marina]|uniref:ABC transporter permease n=1 Tax=Paraoerskovia marina TaxID=545619 RepID=UPI000492CB2E|nr:ABC transporter permease [Paraoerskovia marina]